VPEALRSSSVSSLTETSSHMLDVQKCESSSKNFGRQVGESKN